MRFHLHPSVLHELQGALQGGHERPDFRTIAADAVKSGAYPGRLATLAGSIRSGAVVPPLSVLERLAVHLREEG